MGKKKKGKEEKTELEIKVEGILQRSQERNYRGRRMNISIESLSQNDADSLYKVIGTLSVSVTETPDDSESWIEKNFSLMILDDTEADAIASILMHMNSIPMEFGDMIFEDDFEEILNKDEKAN